MPSCSKQEALLRLFYNASSSFFLLFLFLFSSSILLLKFINFIGSYSIFQRDQSYEYVSSEYDEEEEIQENYSYVDSFERDHLVADIICGGETLLFVHNNNNQPQRIHYSSSEEFISPQDSFIEESEEIEKYSETSSVHKSSIVSDFENEEEAEKEAEEGEEEEFASEEDADSVPNSVERRPTSPITLNLHKSDLVYKDKNYDEDDVDVGIVENKKVNNEENLTRDERFIVFAPTQLETKKLIVEEKDNDEEIYGDSCTVGSTSKSSSEWRSSIKDSGTEDPFSSSSRRSCPKWESYTVFQKYDEEMSFLDRISAQKLHETESLRSIKVSPRSISERIVYKFSKKPRDIRHNPYNELEAAYVAQICITWEALNWNYKNFQSKRASRKEDDADLGCPATIAQQFQQFQVLLQRYVENEPYEHGRRPEIYARIRHWAPKLLLVPEYRESDDDQKEEDGMNTKISTASFMVIMEEGIRTFMNFLKSDKEKPCQILAAYFRRTPRGSVDPSLIRLIKKVNQKKKMKVKDLRRSRKCLRKRKLKGEEEIEILMALIDLKIVSRVLRMCDLNEEQLHWCEEKISKVRVMDGKLHRDSNPLFFPAH